MEEEKANITFAEQIIYALFRPRRYKEMMELPLKRFVGYVLIMMLVLGIIGFVIPAAAVISDFGGFEKLFTQSIGDLSYEDGSLSAEHAYTLKINYASFMIDTSQETVSGDSLSTQGMFLAIGSKTMRISAVVGSQVTDYGVYYLSDYLPDGFDNDSLLSLIPQIYGALAAWFIGTVLMDFMKYGAVSLLFAVVVNGMNRQMQMHLSFGEVFVLCFYGQSFSMLLSNFNQALGLLPELLVSIIGIFVTVHMITASVTSMKDPIP